MKVLPINENTPYVIPERTKTVGGVFEALTRRKRDGVVRTMFVCVYVYVGGMSDEILQADTISYCISSV